MHILITRPQSDAGPLALALEKSGHQTIVEPLLRVGYLDRAAPDLTQAQALIFTSANGLHAYARLTPDRYLPVFAVGEATASACREAGFAEIFTGGGDVDKLAQMIKAKALPEAGRLVHIAGTTVAGDLQGALSAQGFNISREILYETITAQSLSPAALQKISSGEIELILFFSPRTAATFARLAARHHIESCLGKIIAACLSNSVKDVLHLLPWQRIVVAKRPTQQELFVAAGIKTAN